VCECVCVCACERDIETECVLKGGLCRYFALEPSASASKLAIVESSCSSEAAAAFDPGAFLPSGTFTLRTFASSMPSSASRSFLTRTATWAGARTLGRAQREGHGARSGNRQ
jgi:hypothetical protein